MGNGCNSRPTADALLIDVPRVSPVAEAARKRPTGRPRACLSYGALIQILTNGVAPSFAARFVSSFERKEALSLETSLERPPIFGGQLKSADLCQSFTLAASCCSAPLRPPCSNLA